MFVCLFFFFKQKTAYEMRISDWSSDVCSSDLVWVPLIMIGTLAAWFGMNDILSARSSFADQAAIFGRVHTWLMCWLYTGTFGTFIGLSAGFPLLANLVFPEVDAIRYAFIGPLVGALSRHRKSTRLNSSH